MKTKAKVIRENVLELRQYVGLKLKQYETEKLPDNHAMILTAKRMLKLADETIDLIEGNKL